MRQAGCELLLCAGYYYRVPVTDAFPMVNFHPSPLPVGRGAWPMPTESDWTVTPQMDVAQADRVLRAFYGYECVYRTERGRTELIGGRAVPGDSAGRPFPVRGGYIRAERSREL